jgi:hypothetical protein
MGGGDESFNRDKRPRGNGNAEIAWPYYGDEDGKSLAKSVLYW